MRLRRFGMLLPALIMLGCTDLTSPSHLDGTWTQDLSIPGSGVQFTLTTNGNAIAGSGNWTGEACCSGTVTVSGDDTGGDVKLSLTFVATGGAIVPPRTESFEGRLHDVNTLSGVVDGGSGNPVTVTFHRVR